MDLWFNTVEAYVVPKMMRRAGEWTLTLALVSGAVIILWALREGPTEPPRPELPSMALSGLPVIGTREASVAMVIYADFECPSCADFVRHTWPDIKKRYVETGRLLVAVRQFPLRNHAHAYRAAEAAVCAQEQGLFWPLHDRFFLRDAHLDEATVLTDVLAAGVDMPRWQRCMAGNASTLVEADITSSQAFQLGGTPSFLIGSLQADGVLAAPLRMEGNQSFQRLALVLDGIKCP